ncbi:PACE efflux transporter [Ferrimonas senticii]|uniref:PACE efflux transporter n=1 Tax=Ferrimonas senticii TaxID=394566 RepID=UPI0004220FCA|nr:PACE efflux transporter [Ferrimonas senticii]
MTTTAAQPIPMSRRERVGHSLLFEVIALLIMIPAGSYLTSMDMSKMTGVAIAMSLIAMTVNYGYNLWFDRVFGEDRLNRSWQMRLGHGIGFEVSLMGLMLPLLMWATGFDFWTVLILDIGIVLFFFIYAIVFNYGYDQVRARLLKDRLQIA